MNTAEAKIRAPILSAMYPSSIVWKWHRPDPYRWNVYQSLDNGATYFFTEDNWAWGNARRFAPDGGSELMFVVGVDRSGKEITGHSNAVRPDDAPVPHKKEPRMKNPALTGGVSCHTNSFAVRPASCFPCWAT
jgi:hypothetical protein